MRVVVYPRLHQALASKGWTLDDLEERLRERFGPSMRTPPLYWLMLENEPIREVNLEIVAAAATVLGVPLDDLFAIQIVSQDANHVRETRVLGMADSRRLSYLLGQGTLSGAEQSELDGLVSKYGYALRRQRIEERAKKEGRPVEQIRRESDSEIEQTLHWLQAADDMVDNPDRMNDTIKQRLAR